MADMVTIVHIIMYGWHGYNSSQQHVWLTWLQ